MAITTFTGDLSAFFAAGTSLEARPASNWPAIQRPPAAGTAPVGSATATAVSNSSGVVAFTGLADSTEYYVSDAAGTRYVRITTFPERQELMTADAGTTVAELNSIGDVPGSELPQSLAVDVDEYLIGAASFSAGVQAAITAATAGGTVRGAIAFKPGKTYTNNGSALSLVPNVPGLIVYGNGATIKGTSSSTARRLFDLARSADNDTFQNYDIRDLTFDRDSLTSVTNEHVFFGNLIGGAWPLRVNVSNIRLSRCKTINVPTSTTIAYQNVSIGSQHLASSEGTTHTLTDILIEECDFQGGGYGVAIIGGNSSVTTGLGSEIFYDRITLRNVKHDTLVTPTASAGMANFQIGGYAYGGKVAVYGCYGANSADVGIEIDAAREAYVDPATVIQDAWNAAYQNRNFRKPGTGTTPEIKQKYLICGTGVTKNIDPGTNSNTGIHFQLHGDTSTAGYVFGHLHIRGRSVYESALATLSTVGMAVHAQSIQFRHLTIDLDVDCQSLAVNNGSSQNPVFLSVHGVKAGHAVDVERLNITLAGSRAGAGATTWKMLRLCGTSSTVLVRNYTVDIAGLTGLGASDTFYWQLIGEGFTTTLRGSLEAPRFLNAPVGGAHNGVFVAGTGTLTISGMLLITAGEMAQLSAIGSGFDYNIDSTQAAKVRVANFAASSTRAGGVGNSVASAGTVTLPPAPDFFNITGTTNITSVTASWPGRVVTLKFAGILTFTDGSNLLLAGNFVTTADDTITIACDGTNWYEVARSVN